MAGTDITIATPTDTPMVTATAVATAIDNDIAIAIAVPIATPTDVATTIATDTDNATDIATAIAAAIDVCSTFVFIYGVTRHSAVHHQWQQLMLAALPQHGSGGPLISSLVMWALTISIVCAMNTNVVCGRPCLWSGAAGAVLGKSMCYVGDVLVHSGDVGTTLGEFRLLPGACNCGWHQQGGVHLVCESIGFGATGNIRNHRNQPYCGPQYGGGAVGVGSYGIC